MMDARAYCEWAHTGQLRKYTNEPYHNHPHRVADMVRTAGASEDAVVAAYHHDVLEDTPVTEKEYKDRWGERVFNMVWALTTIKRPGENRAARKTREMNRLSWSPSEVATIKLADLLDNTNDILQYDPDFAKQYIREKADLLSVLGHGHRGLLIRATQQVQRYMEQLDDTQDSRKD